MTLTIETDDIVRGRLGGASDWNSMLFRRQLTGALFNELPDGLLGPGLAHIVDVPDDRTAILSVSDDARCVSGKPPTAGQLASSLQRSAFDSSELFLFRLLSRIRARDTTHLEITARVPGLDIARLLASPQFGICGVGDDSTAKYRAVPTGSRGAITFHRTAITEVGHPAAHDIEVVASHSPEHALRLFGSGETDMTCPTSLDQSVWQQLHTIGQVEHVKVFPRLLIGVSLLLPRSARELYTPIDSNLDRTVLSAKVFGNIVPASTWAQVWSQDGSYNDESYSSAYACRDPHTRALPTEDIPRVIEYAPFTPNRILAVELARQVTGILGTTVGTSEVSYSRLLRSPRSSRSMRLVLRYFPWSHPAAMLYPSLEDPSAAAMIGTYKPDMNELAAIYAKQQKLQGEVVLGSLRAASLTRLPHVDPPPTGWFDFAALATSSLTRTL